MKSFHQGHLPHFQPFDGTFFATIRLAGTLPRETIARRQKDFAHRKRTVFGVANRSRKGFLWKEAQFEYFDRFDEALACSLTTRSWLAQPGVATIVTDSLQYVGSTKACMHAWCIMPNHVHVVFSIGRGVMCGPVWTAGENGTMKQHPVSEILGSLKKYSARRANRILGRTGPFWQEESYDHLVRSGEELEKVIRYVLLNPVKARLVPSWKDWPWSYCSEGLLCL